MFKSLMVNTNNSLLNLSILLLRCTIGGILFVAGAGKVLGWFGGMGMEQTIQIFQSSLKISAPLAYLSSYTEFIGGFLLAAGLFTRPAAFAVMINMLVAFLVTLPNGFLNGGASYPFSFLVISVILLLSGPQDYSIDNLLFASEHKSNFNQLI